MMEPLPDGWLPMLPVTHPVFTGRRFEQCGLVFDFEQAALAAAAEGRGHILVLPDLGPGRLDEELRAGTAVAVACRLLGTSESRDRALLYPFERVRLVDYRLPPGLAAAVPEPIPGEVPDAALVERVREAALRQVGRDGRGIPTEILTGSPDQLVDAIALTVLRRDAAAARAVFLARMPGRLQLVLDALVDPGAEGEQVEDFGAGPKPEVAQGSAPSAVSPTASALIDDELPEPLLAAIAARLASVGANAEGRRELALIERVPFGRYATANRPARAERILLAELGELDDAGTWLLDRLPHLRRGHPAGRPLLLVGAPGCGKSKRAEVLARAAGLPIHVLPAAGLSDAISVRGVRSVFSRCMPGMVVGAVSEAACLNPVLVIDELDKMGHSHTHGSPAEALLHLFEPDSARRWRDDFLDIELDLSRLLLVCTANELERVPAPLRDRCDVLHIAPYTTAQREHILRRLLPGLRRELRLPASRLLVEPGVIPALVRVHRSEPGIRALISDLRTLLMRAARTGQTVIRAADVEAMSPAAATAEPDRCVLCGAGILDIADLARVSAGQLPLDVGLPSVPISVHASCLARPTTYFMANANAICDRLATDILVWSWVGGRLRTLPDEEQPPPSGLLSR